MGGWTLEWSEVDPAQCWVELINIWLSEEFKASLQFGKGVSVKEECGATEASTGNSDEWSEYYQ